MNWLKVLMTISGFVCELTETKGQQCRGYSEEDVKCSKLTLINGNVCYDWQWESGFWRNTWKGSSGTFRCLPGYDLSTPKTMLYCLANCGRWSCSFKWDGVSPVCQQTETTAPTPASTSTTTTTRKTTPISTETMQEETAVTAFNLSNITTLSLSSFTVPASKESLRKTITSTRIPELLVTKDVSVEEQNLLVVYVIVPLVAVVSLVTIVLVYVIFRRKRTTGSSKVRNNQETSVRDAAPDLEKKNEAYDPYINLVTVVEEPQVEENAHSNTDITRQKLERDICSSLRDMSPNNLIGHVAGKSAEDVNEYDHLGSKVHKVDDSTYSHTSQDDLDMYSHTLSEATNGVHKIVSNKLNTALLDSEQTYDAMNQFVTGDYSQVNEADQKERKSVCVGDENNLYTVVQKIS